ncbi:unnamed protein product [Camellia sinensis]
MWTSNTKVILLKNWILNLVLKEVHQLIKDESQTVELKQRYELIDLLLDARPLLVFINKKSRAQ